MAEGLCCGDYICLYCEDTKGYMYTEQTSSTYDGLFVYADQHREKPRGVPNIHAITFELVTSNRYKLNKKYRALVDELGTEPEDPDAQKQLHAAKAAADAENADNTAEQARLKGKVFRYGETVQLRHIYTNKYVHVSTTETSIVDKSKMMVSLQPHNSKQAMFKLLPMCKVKVEGEKIEIHDQIVLESLRSPGTFLHVSAPYKIDHFTYGSEVNLGVEKASFTVMRHYSPAASPDDKVRGGSVMRIFHKDLEAFLVAEGVFGSQTTENVHLRVREVTTSEPRSLYPPKSGITFWQVEHASTIIDGSPVKWEQPVRFRHMTTRRYLTLNENFQPSLIEDGTDPNTVFRIHSLSQAPLDEDITMGQNVRIEHVITSTWLHAPNESVYERHQSHDDGRSMQALRWDHAQLLTIEGSPSRKYRDAYTLQMVDSVLWGNFNYVAGMVPFIKNLIMDRKAGKPLSSRHALSICTALKELQEFVTVNGKPQKARQKLLRNLQVVDLMVELLKCELDTNSCDWQHLSQVFKATYQVLNTYTEGRSKKNAWYFAKYIDFFTEALGQTGGVGLACCRMLIELIRDNRKIVDRITPTQVTTYLFQLHDNKHHVLLDLLGVLCVCEKIAITDNQVQIAKELLERHKDFMYHIEMGQDIELLKDILYVSTDNRRTWTPLHKFAYGSNIEYSLESYLFLERQLELYKSLCYGRNSTAINVITRNREFLTWEVAFIGVSSEVLPDRMRARFCDLLIGLYIDGAGNEPVIQLHSNNFIFEEIIVETKGRISSEHVPHDFDSNFPVMRVWMNEFFQQHTCLIASQPGKNMLIKEVLRLVRCLIMYGFLGSKDELQQIMPPVINLINGRNDVPFPPDEGTEYSAGEMKLVNKYKLDDRYLPCTETEYIIAAKLQGLELVDMLLIKEFNRRVRYFVAVFKDIMDKEQLEPKKRKMLGCLLYETFRTELFWKNQKLNQKVRKFLNTMLTETELFDTKLPEILFDLTNYKNDQMITKALNILNKFYNSKTDLFQVTTRSQVLTAVESCRVHRQALANVVTLARLGKQKISDEQASEMCRILTVFKELCHVPHKENIAHPVGQNILVNNGVLSIVMDLVLQEVDVKLSDRFDISERVIKHGLILLRFLAMKNKYVQKYLLERLESLLNVQACGGEQAMAIAEIFRGQPINCLKLQPHHIQRIVRLVGNYKEKAPEFLILLKVLIKDEESGTVLSRNQLLVTKYLMECFKSAAYIMEYDKIRRLKVAIGREGNEHRDYLIGMIDLLASCAEGEGRYVESLCQTLMTVEEIITILNSRNIALKNKTVFARYFVYTYIRCNRSDIECGLDTLFHNQALWKHIKIVLFLAKKVVTETDGGGRLDSTPTSIRGSLRDELSMLSTHDLSRTQTDTDYIQSSEIIDYMLNGGYLLLLGILDRIYKPDKDIYPSEPELLRKLVAVLLRFSEIAAQSVENKTQLAVMTDCLETLLKKLALSKNVLDQVFDTIEFSNRITHMKDRLQKDLEVHLYNQDEVILNERLHCFAEHCAEYLKGQNTIRGQLGIVTKQSDSQYVKDTDEARLPLGEEFQKHVKVFLKIKAGPGGSMTDKQSDFNKAYKRALKLIDQLQISSKKPASEETKEQNELDKKSLQILRAMLVNSIIKLPENWKQKKKTWATSLVRQIDDMQNTFVNYNIMNKIAPLLARKDTMLGMEVMALLDAMLFNANKNVQQSILGYFVSTAEEVFFFFVRDRLNLSVMALKERRSIEAQKKEKEKSKAESKEVEEKKTTDKTIQDAKKKSKLDKRALRKKSLRPFMKLKLANKLLISTDDTGENEFDEDYGIVNPAFRADIEGNSAADLLDDYKEGNDVQLILRVLGGLCDGQNRDHQNYVRIQPDNVRTVNLVTEVTTFINIMYTHINGDVIGILTQVIDTLNEMCQGNQENRAVILNNKIIDYVNFILRLGRFDGCEPDQVISLKMAIGTLLKSLIEENTPEAHQLAKEIRDTLDINAIRQVMTICYAVIQQQFTDLKLLFCGQEKENSKKKTVVTKAEKEAITDLGFQYYYVLAKMDDLDPKRDKRGPTSEESTRLIEIMKGSASKPRMKMALEFHDSSQERAYNFYKKNSQSIEIIKDDCLQKIHFRVKDPSLIREDIKELVKWNIDRTTPSAKLRDLLMWSQDIIADVKYQKKVLKNPFVKFLAMRWVIWNIACILMSLAINVVMLVSWKAPFTVDNVPENATELPDEIYDLEPVVSFDSWDLTLWIMGGTHNFCSLMLFICYLLLKHPTLPDIKGTLKSLKSIGRKKKATDGLAEDEDTKVKRTSYMEVKLLSGQTLFYFMLLGLSVCGTLFHGYFFAFHMLNIMTVNELLKGVVKAVTQNGLSLMWVGIMGVIVIYIYALIGFAFFRASFDTGESRFCHTLAECFITVLRYGAVGELTDNLALHPLANNFTQFSFMTIYQLTFFILFTTIGLNVIFGIIVDTFSELRDLKWTAERDMRDTCFICSRDSYDFEQTGQGMLNHVQNDHNMWSYIYYFMYLNELETSDYSALDLYVSTLLAQDKLDFFPLDRAMSLLGQDEDEKDTRLDDLMATLKEIKEKQDKDELRQRRDREREKVDQWQQEYKKIVQSRSSGLTDRLLSPSTDPASEEASTDIVSFPDASGRHDESTA